MEHEQLIRILALDSDLIKLSEGGRLVPPDNVACYGLPFGDGNINKMDCKFCIFLRERPKYKSINNNTIEIDVSEVKPFRSNITKRFLCPFCISKDIDKIDGGVYYKKNLNFILELYDKTILKPIKEEWNSTDL